MSEYALRIENLSKSYRSHWSYRLIPAISDITLDVLKGESFGYLGHNAAGKTTTIKCILGIVKANTGRIVVDGIEQRDCRQRANLGYLPEYPYFYDHLSVEETLDFLSRLYGMSKSERSQRIKKTLTAVGLEEKRKAAVGSLSKGLKQRLGLAQAIVHEPSLLLLDEPFSGLDPLGRMEMRNLLSELKRKGTTIFLSSHILSDVEDICERVSIMNHGRLTSVFSLDEAPELFGRRYKIIIEEDAKAKESLERILELCSQVICVEVERKQCLQLEFAEYRLAQEALAELVTAGVEVRSFESFGRALEDIFIDITRASESEQKHLRDERETLAGSV